MQLSLLSIGTAPAVQPVSKDAELMLSADMGAGEAAEGFSFEALLEDIGLVGGELASAATVSGDGEIIADGVRVPNLILAHAGVQGKNLPHATPHEALSLLTGNRAHDIKTIAALDITPSQAEKLAGFIEGFLSRTDASVDMGESQRQQLLTLVTQLKQVAAGEEPKPLAPMIAPLTMKSAEINVAAKDTGAVLGQLVKWMRHVLREAAVVPAAQASAAGIAHGKGLTEDASVEEVTLLPFRADDAAQDTLSEQASQAQEELSEDAQVVAYVAAPVVLAQEVVQVSAVNGVTTQAAAMQPMKFSKNDTGSLQVEMTPVEGEQAKDVDLPQDFAELLAKLEKVSEFAKDAVMKQTSSVEVGAADMQEVVEPEPIGLRLNGDGTYSPIGSIAGGATAKSGVISPHAMAIHTPPVEQVHVAIKQAKKEGIETITIQLTPEDLGRVDVRMEKGLDGRTHVVFTVDKSDTFDQLQRDARSLERALADAGVQTDAGSMEFNLRQQHQGNGEQTQGGFASNTSDIGWQGIDAEAQGVDRTAYAEDDETIITRTITLPADNGLDIRV